MFADEFVAVAEGIVRVAGPAVGPGVADDPGPYRVGFDVAHAGDQVAFRIHQTSPEAAFPQGTAAPVPSIEIADIALPHALHQSRYAIVISWRHQQVNVVAHENVCMNRTRISLNRGGQVVEIPGAIGVAGENPLTIITALHHVLRQATDKVARLSCHRANPFAHRRPARGCAAGARFSTARSRASRAPTP